MPTEEQVVLHTKRLTSRLEEIPDLLEQGSCDSLAFDQWHSRTEQSLVLLFGEELAYVRRFAHLLFLEGVMRPYGGGPTSGDMAAFRSGLKQAQAILKDALEELPLVPSDQPNLTSKPIARPEIVVNVFNALSQTTIASFAQVIEAAETLPLPPDEIDQVKVAAEEFAKEANGEQRWPVLARALDKLKSFGSAAYQRVALPLLLELLKKQAGL